MATVTILFRNRTQQLVGDGRLKEVVGVSYRTQTTPPRLIYTPGDLYRDATAEEYPAGSPIAVVPKDEASQAAEDEAIKKDLTAADAFTHPTREIG